MDSYFSGYNGQVSEIRFDDKTPLPILRHRNLANTLFVDGHAKSLNKIKVTQAAIADGYFYKSLENPAYPTIFQYSGDKLPSTVYMYLPDKTNKISFHIDIP
jgi:prepilin-type processing-associated H-X9-DG protein